MKYVKGAAMARLVLVVSLGYLCVAHLMRQIYDYGNFVLDITGYCTTHLFTTACYSSGTDTCSCLDYAL